MIYISHRVNTVRELQNTPCNLGLEIDLRDRGDRLILQHAPFKDGEDFEPWLQKYCHNTLILNVKNGRVELRVKELLGRLSVSILKYLCNFQYKSMDGYNGFVK